MKVSGGPRRLVPTEGEPKHSWNIPYLAAATCHLFAELLYKNAVKRRNTLIKYRIRSVTADFMALMPGLTVQETAIH